MVMNVGRYLTRYGLDYLEGSFYYIFSKNTFIYLLGSTLVKCLHKKSTFPEICISVGDALFRGCRRCYNLQWIHCRRLIGYLHGTSKLWIHQRCWISYLGTRYAQAIDTLAIVQELPKVHGSIKVMVPCIHPSNGYTGVVSQATQVHGSI